MKMFTALLMIVIASAAAFGQKSAEAIKEQLRDLKADSAVTVTYDAASDATKVMAIGPNAADADAKAANIQAMNFGMAFTFSGKVLAPSPEVINLTFWVMSKKPRFGGVATKWIAAINGHSLDLGEARYAAKPNDNMEYLNFKIQRSDLGKLVTGKSVNYTLGTAKFTFTPDQMKVLNAMYAVSSTN